MTGRLLRHKQAAEAMRPCACGHAVSQHRERRYNDPQYEPLVFVCDACECEVRKE